MQYRVVVPKKVQKELNKIDVRYQPQILAAFLELSNNPYIGKKLEGEHKGEWSYRVGVYRIIFRIKNQELIVLIVKVGHRGGVY
jgi:mRNA interferase RelE/StbE